MAGMKVSSQIKLLIMINGVIKDIKKPVESLRRPEANENRYSKRHVISSHKHHPCYYN
jgi:hypothetical protein